MPEVKIEKLNDLFTFVKIEPLLKTYTDINPNGGIRMRLNGKGTNSQGRKELKTEEKEGLESALKKFFTEGLEFLNNQNESV